MSASFQSLIRLSTSLYQVEAAWEPIPFLNVCAQFLRIDGYNVSCMCRMAGNIVENHRIRKWQFHFSLSLPIAIFSVSHTRFPETHWTNSQIQYTFYLVLTFFRFFYSWFLSHLVVWCNFFVKCFRNWTYNRFFFCHWLSFAARGKTYLFCCCSCMQ